MLTLLPEFVSHLRCNEELSERSVLLRRYYVQRFLLEIPEHDITKITNRHVREWLHAHGWRPNTRKSARAALKAFFAWATSEKIIAVDPTGPLKPVSVPKGVPHPAPSEPLRDALQTASDRDGLVIALGAFAGLRRTEIASLPWSGVQWNGLRVIGKGEKVRVIPLHPELRARLERERELRSNGSWGTGWRFAIDSDSPFVFPGRSGGHMHHDRVARIINTAMPGYWPHDLRHRFASKAYAVERDLLTVQRLMGHSSSTTTEIYVDPPRAAAVRAVEGSSSWDDAA